MSNNFHYDYDTHKNLTSAGGPGASYTNIAEIAPGRGYKVGKKRQKLDDDEDYFYESDEEEKRKNKKNLEIIASCPFISDDEKDKIIARGGTSAQPDSDEEEDPLDAFMADIEKEVKSQTSTKPASTSSKKANKKGVRDDLEELDAEESFYKYMEENPNAGVNLDDDDILDYDEDGNPIHKNKKIIEPLPIVYHSDIEYAPFDKNFYVEHEDITKLTDEDVKSLRAKLGVTVSGFYPNKPVTSFGHFGFDDKLLSIVRKMEYTQPTPIQAQGTPCCLGGRDFLGIAKTGSGKTAAFVWPLIPHVLDQPVIKDKEGPIALIVSPTRELCQQIHAEVRRFGKTYGIRSVPCYGGGSMYEQQKALVAGCEVVVATPGRIIDHVKKGNTNLRRVTFLVFDEADKMFEMGFEYQIRSIANNIRPDRQTLLFSATFKRRIEKLARDILCDPVKVVQGDAGEANADVQQIVEVFQQQEHKWPWLLRHMVPLTSAGSLLVFVTKKVEADNLHNRLKGKGYDVALLHGDMNQFDRNTVITQFKKRQVSTLIATDVAARGLDIPSIKNVINYDVARDIDTHTHRIGRTGRAGEKGTAYTLVAKREVDFAGDLVRNMEAANQIVTSQLMNLALQGPRFKKSRYKQGKGKGFVGKERPGLGAPMLGSASGFRSASGSGVMGGRASSVKSYFKNQYQSNFVKSTTGETKWESHGFKQPGEANTSTTNTSNTPKRKRKSRWE